MQAQAGVTEPNRKRQTAFLSGMAALLVVFLLLLFCGNIGGQTNVFYLGGRDFMADALHTEDYARELDPYDFVHEGERVPFKDGNYPPLAYVFFKLVDLLSGGDSSTVRALVTAILFSAVGALLLAGLCYRMTDAPRGRRIAIAAALLLSAPMLYAFERGNIILYAAALCAVFLLNYQSEKPLLREAAFIALAVAAALKIFPALLGLLLLRERRWREALRLMLYGVVAVFVPFCFMQGGFQNLPLLLTNFQAHTAYYTRLIYPRFGFRLFSSLAYDAPWANAWMFDQLWKFGDKLYAVMPAIDVLLSLCCALTALNGRRAWERVLAVMLILVNYPVNSGLYTALYLLPAVAMFLSCGEHARGDGWVLFAFLVLLSPVQLPFPAALLQQGEGVLCNLTDILRNLACYALFIAFAARGVCDTVRKILSLRGASAKQTA